MDHDRFDSFTRIMSSRRAAGKAIVGPIVALIGLTKTRDAGAAPCPKPKKRCGERCIPKRGCCTTAQCKPKNTGKVCKRSRCVCPAGTKRCGKRCLLKAAACPPKPDASCPPGDGFAASVSATSRIAQIFTEPNGGRLTVAAIWFRRSEASSGGTFELRLNTVDPDTGVPTETTLGLAQRSAESVPTDDFDWVRFTFPTPPRLQPGRQYALVLATLGTNFGWFTEFRNFVACPGGGLFVATNEPGTFVVRPGSVIPYLTFVSP